MTAFVDKDEAKTIKFFERMKGLDGRGQEKQTHDKYTKNVLSCNNAVRHRWNSGSRDTFTLRIGLQISNRFHCTTIFEISMYTL